MIIIQKKYHNFPSQTLKHQTDLYGASLFCLVKFLRGPRQNTGHFVLGWSLGFLNMTK